ncbi:MAG: NADPH:quinone reductase-like Zn-dependent oxidoreductase [Ilumatobacter sp.]|jgi:NADPH:quinone reductase-like Zn-dependent oxidoreductase
MRAAVLTGLGGPEVLILRDDVPVPVPAADEVLIRVAACGMNNTDINTRVGWYSKSITEATSGDGFAGATSDDGTWSASGFQFPRIQGADPSGRVVAVGADVDEAIIGRRALVDCCLRDVDEPMRRDLAGYLGSERDGGFAEYVAVPARNVHVHNSQLTDVELASFPCSWATANHMQHRIRLTTSDRILITGASGGVGSALVSLAKLRGATVTAVCSASKADGVRALGADHVIDRSHADLHAAARDANGGPFDVVADVVGGPDTPGWFESLRRGGRYVTCGAIAGPVVDLDLRTLYLNDLEFHGTTVYDPAVFTDLVNIIERGDARPVVGAVYALEQIHEAQEAFQHKHHVGAMVLTI